MMVCFACNKFNSQTAKIAKEWHNKVIQIPDNIRWTINGKDTINTIKTPYKIGGVIN